MSSVQWPFWAILAVWGVIGTPMAYVQGYPKHSVFYIGLACFCGWLAYKDYTGVHVSKRGEVDG